MKFGILLSLNNVLLYVANTGPSTNITTLQLYVTSYRVQFLYFEDTASVELIHIIYKKLLDTKYAYNATPVSPPVFIAVLLLQ